MEKVRRVVHFFDRLEDRVRSYLSHWPIVYALIGGVGIVLFWRGVWHTTDFLSLAIPGYFSGMRDFSGLDVPWWDGPLSLIISTILLLLVGLFVSAFIGDSLILSGLKKEKKMVEKEEEEIETEEDVLQTIRKEVKEIERDVEELKKSHHIINQ